MRVYIANFGRENYEWPECLRRGTVATMNDVDLQPLWRAGEREKFIERCMKGKTAAGITPTRPVASRWFNLMSIIEATADDIWIHRAKDEFWWTTSHVTPPTFEEKVEPITRGSRVVVCHKPCDPWSDRTRTGNRLEWGMLHPRAKEFLFTEGTLQELGTDNAAYAMALLNGQDLTPWHSRPDWKKTTIARMGKGGAATIYNGEQKAAYRMAAQAFMTSAAANGQQVTAIKKIKDVVGFASQTELERYILKLLKLQEGLCALTDLPLQMDCQVDDPQLMCSLDRIESDGHYAEGNLQVVCRFANGWKSASADAEFRRLIKVVRSVTGIVAN